MQLQLKKDQTLTLDRPPEGLRIDCCRGRIWLTQSHDPRDYGLLAGQQFRTSLRGRIVIWALDDSAVTIESDGREIGLVWQPRLRNA